MVLHFTAVRGQGGERHKARVPANICLVGQGDSVAPLGNQK